MSNWTFRAATAALCIAEAAAFAWAVAPRGRRWGIVATNLLSGSLVMIFLVGELPSELRSLTSGDKSGVDFDDYKTSLLVVLELIVLTTSTLALFRRRVPATLIWLGFAMNAVLSGLLLLVAFFFEFRCCGYL